MEVQEIQNLDIFLEKSEYGIAHVYQLHSKLGGVFIDASFQDEAQSIVFKTRIDMVSPKLIVGDLKWDEHGFPYENETYEVGDKEVEVPLYRPLGPAFDKFLFDIVDHIIAPDPSPTIPIDIVANCQTLYQVMIRVADFFKELKGELGDKERRAINTYCGDVDMWNRGVYNIYEALVVYLNSQVLSRASKYYEIMKAANDKRHTALSAAVNELIIKTEDILKMHGFKKGFVSN